MLLIHWSLADDAFDKQLADATKKSSQRDVATYQAGDAMFAKLREQKDLSPSDIGRTWTFQGQAAATRRDFPLAVIAYNKALAVLPADAVADRVDVLVMFSSVYMQQQRYEDAAAKADEVLKIEPKNWEAATTRATALERLNRLPEAAASIQTYLAANADLPPGVYANLAGYRIRILSADGQWKTVISEADVILARSSGHMGISDVKVRTAEARRLKILALVASSDVPAALVAAREALDASYTDAANLTAAILSSESPDMVAGFTTVILELQASDWRSTAIYDHTQTQLVKLLLAMGETDAALWEARSFYLNCSTSMLGSAAILVSQCLKAKDGDLVRANQFLRFVRFGTAGEDGKVGTGDDLADPTMDLKPVVSEARKSTALAHIASASDDWRILLDVARQQVAIGQLDAALASYRQAFAKSPGNQRDTQIAADAIANYVGRLSRDEALVKDVMSFMMYGPDGPDGKPKTDDDLADPAARVAALLKSTTTN